MRKTARARNLRRNQTEMEIRLWLAFRDRRFAGFKIRRQRPIGRYIVDFVCLDRRLIIEVDGGQHAERRPADESRTASLETAGFKVVRVWNSDVHENLPGVLDFILAELEGRAQFNRPAPGRDR